MTITSKTSKNVKAAKPIKRTAVWEGKTAKGSSKKAPAAKLVDTTPRCRICNKPLVTPEDIKAGVGKYCSTLDADQVQSVLEERTVTDKPKNYIKLSEVLAAAKEAGCPTSRVMKALGGNRGLGTVRNADWQYVYYKGARWLPKGCLKQLGILAKEKAHPKAPSAPKGKKVSLPAPKGKAPLPAKKAGGLKRSTPAPTKKVARKVMEGGVPVVEIEESEE
jgi:hypothetical protein